MNARTLGWAGTVLIGCWMLVGVTAAQPHLQADARVSVDSVRIGERFTLTLTVRRPAGAAAQFPTADADPIVFGDLEVLDRRSSRTRRPEAGRVIESASYEVTTFALDSAHVPGLPVRVVGDGDTAVVATSARTVPVPSVLEPGATDLREGDLLAPFPYPLWAWLLLGAAVLVGIGGGGYLWWRTQTMADAETDRSASEEAAPQAVAAARLRALRSHDLTDPEEVESFYVELADAVRTYLSRRLDIRTRERTTREVVRALARQTDVPASTRDRVQDVLEQADLVKFAGVRPAPPTATEALRDARTVIDAVESTAAPNPPIDAVAMADTGDSP